MKSLWKLAVLVLLPACRIGFGQTSTDVAPPGTADAPPGAADAPADGGTPGLPVGFGGGGSETFPTVAWDGSRFLVGWLGDHGRLADPRRRGGEPLRHPRQSRLEQPELPPRVGRGHDATGAIQLATVRADGTLDHIDLALAPDGNREPALASNGAGTTVLAYVHDDGTPGVRVLVLHP